MVVQRIKGNTSRFLQIVTLLSQLAWHPPIEPHPTTTARQEWLVVLIREDPRLTHSRISTCTAVLAAAAGALVVAARAYAGGSAENAVLIIDPSDATSMYVGNYYKHARNIPDTNVLYMSSKATNYSTFTTTNQSAFAGSILQRGIADHTDYAVVAPFSGFYVPYSGEPTGAGSSATCSLPNRYSISAVYTLSQVSASFISSNTAHGVNEFFGDASASALGFSSNQGYLDGAASTSPFASKYYLSAQLGYTNGPFANTVPDLLSMIDRSVAADGNGRSAGGTFYYMNNTADALRNARACGSFQGCSSPSLYDAAAAEMASLGDSASVLSGILPPNGTTNIFGVMTGSATLGIPGAAFTLVPGAFGDHLTSWAALFDCTGGCQTPVSAWINQGASGSDGTVEEPCADVTIFPSAYFHYYYAQGMSIGESYLRSLQSAPTHNLLYGDPLTRAFAYIPAVTVNSPPGGNLSGSITITPSATTPNPGASIATYDLLVDGAKMGSASFGKAFSLDTQKLPDGRHDLRVLAYDNTPVKNVGRWIGTLDTLNYGHGATLSVSPASGNLVQHFTFAYAATGGVVSEVRLVQNGRVLAASTAASGALGVYGQNLGAGTTNVHLEALYTDNRLARSVPVSVNVTSSGTPAGPAPVAYSYSKSVTSPTAFLVELPASFDAAPNTATYTLLSSPTKATVLQSGFSSSGPYRIIQPISGSTGSEQLQFQVKTSAGSSNVATVTLNY
jgi:uncharacterized protein (TIGR03790 family)